MKLQITLGGRTREVDVSRTREGWTVALDGEAPEAVQGSRLDDVSWRITRADQAPRTIPLSLRGEQLSVLDGGRPVQGTAVDPRAHALELGAGDAQGEIRTQMPGAVVRVLVAEGDEVAEGAVLLVVEAMKMENEFKAPFAGRVVSLPATEGTAVEAGTVLLVLEPTET